jgi:hypothetical protein
MEAEGQQFNGALPQNSYPRVGRTTFQNIPPQPRLAVSAPWSASKPSMSLDMAHLLWRTVTGGSPPVVTFQRRLDDGRMSVDRQDRQGILGVFCR